MADIQQGTTVTIASDIVANGVVTFARGEQVSIGQVSPNPQMPQYKYTVYSQKAGQWFQLRDEDIIAPSPAGQPAGYTAPPSPPGTPGATTPPPMGVRSAPRTGSSGGDFISEIQPTDWMVAGGGLAMIIGTFVGFIWFGTFAMLIGIGAIVLVCLERFANVELPLPFDQGWLYVMIGGVGVLIGLLSLLDTALWAHWLGAGRYYVGSILILLGGAAVAVGGFMRAREIL